MANLRADSARFMAPVPSVFPISPQKNDTPFQRIAGVIDMIQHLQAEKTERLPIPKELQVQAHNEDMNIQIMLLGNSRNPR
jgi:hypothetical protein